MRKNLILLVISSFAFQASAQQVVNGLLMYIPFNSNLSEINHSVQLTSTEEDHVFLEDRNGNNAASLRLDGEYQLYRSFLPSNSPLRVSSTYTVSIWATIPDGISVGRYPTVLAISNSVIIRFHKVSLNQISTEAVIYNSHLGGTYKTIQGPTFNTDDHTGDWVHFALTKNASSYNFYVHLEGTDYADFNSVQAGSTAGEVPVYLSNSYNFLSLGYENDNNNPYSREYYGKVDDILIYNRGLNFLEVFSLYEMNNSNIVTCNPPAPELMNDLDDLSVCLNTPVFLQIRTMAHVERTWWDAEVGGNLLTSSSTYQPRVDSAATYSYYMQNSYACGASDRVRVEFIVRPLPTVNVDRADENNRINFCNNEDIVLNASGASYLFWGLGVQNGLPFSMPDTDSFTIRLYAADEGCDRDIYYNVIINAPPQDSIYVKGNGLYAIELDGEMYNWIDCESNNSFLNSPTAVSLFPGRSGEFKLELSRKGCVVTSECVSLIFDENSATKRISTPSFNIYPNPSQGFLKIEGSENIHQIRIFDLAGRLVFIQNTNQTHYTIDLTQFNEGVFVVELTCKDAVYRQIISKE